MAPTAGCPRVSVIIPCYNTAAFVAEALQSVFAQTYTDYEAVVVNDGSPDTAQLELALAPWFDRIVYLKTSNFGLAGARNNGIHAARGELIALLDSDDVWEANYLEEQVGMLDAHRDADIVYPNARNFGDVHGAGAECWYSRGQVTFSSLVRGICDINAPRTLESGKADKCVVFYSVLARRAALERAGLFDQSLRSCEDLDIWLRCVKNGSHIIYHRQVLVRYRRRSGSLSADPVWMLDHILKVFRKARSSASLTSEEQRVLDDAISEFQGRKAFHEGKRAFSAGDVPLAIERLQEANRYLDSVRLTMILLLLRTAPRLARLAYAWKKKLAGNS